MILNMHINNLSVITPGVVTLNYILLTSNLPVVTPGVVTLNRIFPAGNCPVAILSAVVFEM